MEFKPDPMVDWCDWLRRWDAQQQGYLPEREARFNVMFDVLAVLLPEAFVALDLACGPGSLSCRLLQRFPQARCLALDYDPVLLTIGQGALGTLDGRLQWVEADLAQADWVTRLGGAPLDAVLSTTALHWLDEPTLVQVYQQLSRLVRPGGVFLNGDHIAFEPQLQTFRAVAKQWRMPTSPAVSESWAQWWNAVAHEPALAAPWAERQRRYPSTTHGEHAPSIDLHARALRLAGFREVGVIWQQMDDRVLMAIR